LGNDEDPASSKRKQEEQDFQPPLDIVDGAAQWWIRCLTELILENIGAASFKDYNPIAWWKLTPEGEVKVIEKKPQQNWICCGFFITIISVWIINAQLRFYYDPAKCPENTDCKFNPNGRKPE
jgi:hypothetical protein